MAFPPAVLPTNRTNATPQQDTHPADHNAVNAAVNDIVTYVGRISRGVLERVQMPVDQGGFGGTELNPNGMSVLVPAATPVGRLFGIAYDLRTVATAVPGSTTPINIRVRAGSQGGTLIAEQTHYWVVGQGGGPWVHGEFVPVGLTPGTLCVLTFQAGAGTWTIGAGTTLSLKDLGSV